MVPFLFFLHLKHHRMGHFEVVRKIDAVPTIGFSAKGGFFLASQDLDFARFEVHWCFKPIGVGYRAFLLVQEEDAIHFVAFLSETELPVCVWIYWT